LLKDGFKTQISLKYRMFYLFKPPSWKQERKIK